MGLNARGIGRSIQVLTPWPLAKFIRTDSHRTPAFEP